MTTIWETTYDALDGLGYDLAANVLRVDTGSELPDEFLVYQLISDPPELHADDAETLRSYQMQVSVYSRSGLATIPALVEAAMLAAGFTRLPSRELPYNRQTRHYGLAMDFNYLAEE